MDLVFWAVMLVVALGVEYHTRSFVAVFLAIAAALTFAPALVGAPFWAQVICFLGASAGGVIAVRPMALRRFARRHHEVDMTLPTQMAMTHLTGTVEIAVGDESHPGRVKIQGETWRAVTEWPEPIAVGTPIVVDRAFGTTLWVNPR